MPGPARTPWADLCAAALTGRRAAAEALVRALADARGAERATALRALTEAPPALWPLLDRRARGGPFPGGDDPLGLVLRSMSADGYAREYAVRRLAGLPGPGPGAALALRTADWVGPVRERARAALPGRLAPDEAAAAVRVLLRLRGRERSTGVLDDLRAALADPAHRRAVRALAADADPPTRRFGMELALELGAYVPGDLVRTALADRDQVCRELCAGRLLELDPEQAGRLLRARSAGVRELAVAALPEDVPAARLVAPLADRSRVVRAQARWALYRRGEPPAEVYRAQLRRCGGSTPPRLVAGLAAGLGECGDASDVPLLARLASPDPHPWEAGGSGPAWPPPVRRAAVRALGLLAGPEEKLSLLVPLLGEEEPSVVREALDALLPVAREVPGAPVRAAVERPEPAVRRAAVRLVRAADPWRRLELDLELAADPRPEVAAEAREDLWAWLGGQYPSRPGRELLERTHKLLAGAGLPERLHRGVAFVLERGRP
ncbi:hypothetical protein [Streptomyces capparidis]